MLSEKRLSWLYSLLAKINGQRHIYCIRNGFIAIMPAMIVGAFASMFVSLPIPAYQEFMNSIAGGRWNTFCDLVYNGTTQIISLLVVVTICINLAAWYNKSARRVYIREGICGIIGLGCFVIMSAPLGGELGLSLRSTGVTGLFVAIVVAVCACELFIHIGQMKQNLGVMADDPNFAVPQSFNSVLPATLTLAIFAFLRAVFVACGYSEGLQDIVYGVLSLPFRNGSNSIGSLFVFVLFSHVMWLFGIHGTNVLDDVAQNIYAPAAAENAAAVAAGMDAPNLLTKTMYDVFVYMGGSGVTIGLLIALIIFGKARSYKTMYRYALPTSLFNINEPVIFGIPIVLNPVFAIPFVLTPLVMYGTTALAMVSGLVPYTVAEVNWATPVFVSGYLATGSVAGILLQVVNIAIAVFIYAPFVKLNEHMMALRFNSSYEQLSQYVMNEYDASQRLSGRVDEIGAVARKLATGLGEAMGTEEMYLVYQPIVNARTGQLHSVEALLRWNSKHNGFINPMVVVALAEENGQSIRLGRWVIETAIRQRAEWTQQGLPGFHVSVNVSATQLLDKGFASMVKELLEKYDVPPRQLQIEIVETMKLTESEITQVNLLAVTELGVTVAMDDFGVGHSSLAYLRSHPITTLKIDASLTTDVIQNPTSLNIISTISDLCQLLGLDTIVEHVEEEQQLQLIMGVGPHLIQGYYFSPPLKAQDLPAYINSLQTKAYQMTEEIR